MALPLVPGAGDIPELDDNSDGESFPPPPRRSPPPSPRVPLPELYPGLPFSCVDETGKTVDRERWTMASNIVKGMKARNPTMNQARMAMAVRCSLSQMSRWMGVRSRRLSPASVERMWSQLHRLVWVEQQNGRVEREDWNMLQEAKGFDGVGSPVRRKHRSRRGRGAVGDASEEVDPAEPTELASATEWARWGLASGKKVRMTWVDARGKSVVVEME